MDSKVIELTCLEFAQLRKNSREKTIKLSLFQLLAHDMQILMYLISLI